MSRIDEIKARLENYSVEYHSPIIGHQKAEPDMLYLLDRNEELQRRAEKMERGLKSVMWLYREGDGPSEEVFERAYMSANDALDAKEQDDD